MKVLLVTLNAKYIHSSLALRSLRAACRPSFPEVRIAEFTINNELLAILNDIGADPPEVLGLACYIWNIDMTLRLAALVKKTMPKTRIVLGGPEVSYTPEDILQECSCVDWIIQGEGEEVLPKLLKALQQGEATDNLLGVATRTAEGVSLNGGLQIVDNISLLPFPYLEKELSELENKIIYYETSRGCPFNCAYCLSSTTPGVRHRDLSKVLEELQFFVRQDVRQVKFVDRTFNSWQAHYQPILRFLATQNCRTNFHFEITADLLPDDVILELGDVPPGRFQFEIGVQSTCEATLGMINRQNDWRKIKSAVEMIKNIGGIHLHLDLIAGLPGENYSRLGESFNAVYSLKPDMLQIGFLKMLKGSEVRRMAGEYEYVFMDEAPYEVLSNRDLPYSEIRQLKLMEEVFNYTYNSGCFSNTLRYLIDLSGDAFAFYSDFATWWERSALFLAAHAQAEVCRFLAEFGKEKLPACESILLELLKFDLLLSGGRIRPPWLHWDAEKWTEWKSEFFMDEQRVQEYIPSYRLTSWRELKRLYHIESFSFDVAAFVTTGVSPVKKTTHILFCLDKKQVIWHEILLRYSSAEVDS